MSHTMRHNLRVRAGSNGSQEVTATFVVVAVICDIAATLSLTSLIIVCKSIICCKYFSYDVIITHICVNCITNLLG